MNKTKVFLGLSIRDMSKIVIHEYLNDYTKPKYGDKTKLCYTDMNSLTVHVKSEDVYSELLRDVEKIFDASSYEAERPLPIGKNKKVIGPINNELGGRIMEKFIVVKKKL